LKLLSGNVGKEDKPKFEKDDNDRQRNQGLGANKVSGNDQFHNLKKGIEEAHLSRKEKRMDLEQNKTEDKSRIIEHFRKEKHMTEKERLMNKRKMKMDRK
jgi:hypothetical protein